MATSERSVARPGISGCIVAMNEEDRIGDCVRSLEFCDEVILIDSHSSDRTREIAAELGAVVVERDWPGFGAQKEFAIEHASNDWVLCLDADERVSAELRAEILALQERGFPGHQGWRMPRLSVYLGHWMRHGSWYPDAQLRLFDRRSGHWGGNDPHDKVFLEGSLGRLRGPIHHYPYRSFDEHMQTIARYTTMMANGLARRGKRARLVDFTLRPAWRLFRYLVIQRGVLDGWRGILMGLLETHYTTLKYAKLYVMQNETPAPPPPCAEPERASAASGAAGRGKSAPAG